MAKTTTINITPEGCKTPEGIERVNKALEAKDSAAYDVTNRTINLLKECGDILEKQLAKDDDEYAKEQYDELKEAIKTYQDATEEFLYAISGRPNPRHKAE